MDHGTAAYFHPMYDQSKLEWNLEGIPTASRPSHFPELAWSTDIAGRVTRRAAAATGLPAGVPVVTGATDAPAEALSAGIHSLGDTMLMYGSSHFIIQVVDEFHPSLRLWPAPYVLPGCHVVAAGTSTAGTFTRWYADLLAPAAGMGPDLYAELAAQAQASPPGARGLLALPYLSGERTPLQDSGARGALLGLSLEHNRGDVARAVVESIAQSAAAALRCFSAEGLPPRRVFAVGGGTKNAAWVQALSDITGFDQRIAAGPGAAYGDAMMAALGTGLLAGPEDIVRWVRPSDTVIARPEYYDLYARQRRLFDQLYTATRPIVSELTTLRTSNEGA
jgi:xylulokinase